MPERSTFNKSACLDLESHLIRWLAGDGKFTVMNGNDGIIDARHYERDLYRENFREIFENCVRKACSNAASLSSRTVTILSFHR